MRARVIDGKALAETRRAALAQRVAVLRAQGVEPCLAGIGVGEDAGWRVYQRRQAKRCAELGLTYRAVSLPAGCDQEDLHETIEGLNADPAVHGIILQAPLPSPLDQRGAQALLSPLKDVEGVTPANLGLLLSGRGGLAPCTARSAFSLARHALGDLRGVEAVVVGASVIVGRPLAQLLIDACATVTVCHIDTRDVAAHTRRADLVVVAVGKPGLLTAAMVKPGATVIDVGINRVGEGIVGDVAPEVWEVAGQVSPVPGGVGELTTVILLEQAVEAAERLARLKPVVDGATLARWFAHLGQPLDAEVSERLARLLSSHLVGNQRTQTGIHLGPSPNG